MNPHITGDMLIGPDFVHGTSAELRAFDVGRNRELEPAFGIGELKHVDQACDQSAESAGAYRDCGAERRSALLNLIATNIENISGLLIERATAETGIKPDCARDQLSLKIHQLKTLSGLARDINMSREWPALSVTDESTKDSFGVQVFLRPIGPVAAFASPRTTLAFASAGVDVVSALAAGCPVISVSHPSQLGVSELIGRVIHQSIANSGLPSGIYSQLIGRGREITDYLADDPRVKGVAFIGTQRENEMLSIRVAGRGDPIPIFSQTSTVNPTFLLPNALNARAEHFAQSFVEQLTLGVGQRQAKSALLVAVNGDGYIDLRESLASALETKAAELMFSPDVHNRYVNWIDAHVDMGDLNLIAQGMPADRNWTASAYLFEVDAKTLMKKPAYAEQIFGPAGILVKCESVGELTALASKFSFQSSVSIHFEHGDERLGEELIRVLEQKTGRIHAVISPGIKGFKEFAVADLAHPQPQFPLSFEGANVIERFLRPVAYAGFRLPFNG